MNEYNNIKNRFDTNQVIRQTVNPSSLSVIETQQNYDNNLKRSIVRNFVKDLESLGWDIREDSNGSIMIETEYDKEYYSSYSDAFDVYKDTIVDDVYQGILDKEGYYNFYLGKEQIRYLGLEKEYEKQMEHAVEGVNLRSDASADAEFVAGVLSGEALKCTGVCDNGWIRVDYNGQTCYASGDYVSTTPPVGAATADTAAAQ